MRTQARGLAKAVAGEVIEKVVTVRRPWRWLPAGWPGVLRGVDAKRGDRLVPPWPDLIVTCGRRSAILGLAVKRKAGGGPLLVHVQDPLTSLKPFDLVIAMEHDDAKGPNVRKVLTTLHDMTPERLGAAAKDWRPRLAHLPKPIVGVLLGGPTRHTPFGVEEARDLQTRLAALRGRIGGSVIVVPSRRTPDEALAVFAQAAKGDPAAWVWDRTGDNPYVGVLALADRLVVTGDSVSMVSEALATPHHVEIFAGKLRRRHEGFIQKLIDRGLVRWFDGKDVELPVRRPIDTTEEAAGYVRELIAARRGEA
jgi:hypothetical protein